VETAREFGGVSRLSQPIDCFPEQSGSVGSTSFLHGELGAYPKVESKTDGALHTGRGPVELTRELLDFLRPPQLSGLLEERIEKRRTDTKK